jgi:hypothetical protein|tara:strand:- start:174 stop:629 length:456 start_codon:yes stop_codon:yes gene_type:complete
MSNNKDRSEYQRIDDTEIADLKLTLPEILFIDDNISLMLDGRDFENMMPLRPTMPTALILVPIDFIDKIGKAFVELLHTPTKTNLKDRAVSIRVSEMELYMLREVCISRAKYLDHRVGLTLKKKVLFALYSKKKKQHDLLEELLKDLDLGD